MVSNQYNMNLKLGYEEILHLVQQLSNKDKIKLVETIYADASSKNPIENTFQYLEEAAKQAQKRAKSISAISDSGNNTALGKEFGLNIDKLNVVSVDDVNTGSYQNRMDKEAVVGKWSGDEPAENLINMLSK